MTDHTHTHLNGAVTTHRAVGEKLLIDWREAVAKEVAALEASVAASGDAELQHAYRASVEHSRQVARLAWTRLQSPADVRVRAEIVRHALWPTYHGDRRFDAMLEGREFNDGLELGAFDERAVVELVTAALWMAMTSAPAGGHAESAPGERPRRPQLTDGIPVPMPGEVPIMVEDAKAAINAARLLWTSNNLDDTSPNRRVTESFWFCIDTAERELKRVTDLIDAATERAVDAWHKSTPPTQAVIDVWGKGGTTT